MLPRIVWTAAFGALCLVSGASASGKSKPHTYERGVIVGWNETPAALSTTPVRGAYGGVHPRPTITYGRKFYELSANGMTYTLNNCSTFQPKEAVQYRTDGGRLYIARGNGQEYKCRIMGARAEKRQPR